MGCVENITADKFPEQGSWVGRRVEVCFHYSTARRFPGVVVRDDVEEPFRTIIRLDDGRHVLGVECHYGIAAKEDDA